MLTKNPKSTWQNTIFLAYIGFTLTACGNTAVTPIDPTLATTSNMSFQQEALLTAINEVRMLGTLGGVDVTQQSCVKDNFKPLTSVVINGVANYASQKHANYLAMIKYEAHAESVTTAPEFYGAMPRNRLLRSYKEMAPQAQWTEVGENVAAGYQEVASVVKAWLVSTSHCETLMDPIWTSVGIGYVAGNEDRAHNRLMHNWVIMMVR